MAARGLGDGVADRVAAIGAAGHVLDFDDTHASSLAHLSAPTAPAALVLGATLGTTLGHALEAHAAGFEVMGAVAAANHPQIRARGWHPTAVCGVVGAAVSAARLLELDRDRTEHAVRLALLRAGGLHAAFGSDGKALQVGMAAASGVDAARLAAAGATAGAEVLGGFEEAFGARWPADALEAPSGRAAIRENWIKAYPCCLQTHGAIEAAELLRKDRGVPAGAIVVAVHPVSLQTAWRTAVANGLEAKFSIPYLTAFTLLNGPPGIDSFRDLDPAAQDLAAEAQVELVVRGALRGKPFVAHFHGPWAEESRSEGRHLAHGRVHVLGGADLGRVRPPPAGRDQRRDPGLQRPRPLGVENGELAGFAHRHLGPSHHDPVVRPVGLGHLVTGLLPVVGHLSPLRSRARRGPRPCGRPARAAPGAAPAPPRHSGPGA